MRKNPLLTAALLSLMLTFSACQPDDDGAQPDDKRENQFVRVLVADDASTSLFLLDPRNEKMETFTGQFSGNNLYPTASGRYAAVVNSTNHFVQFFDSGIEAHDDHAHLKGTPKWALTTATGPKPSHFYAWGNNMALFNDGDGSLSLTSEDLLHQEDKASHVVVDQPHHGAVILFANGTLAVTQKDNSVAGTLPERVKIIDRSGKVLHSSTIATGGIHGDAGDGRWALFGSTTGILKVSSEGSQNLITYPGNFGTNWLSTIYYGKECKKFMGYRAKFGVYFIDPEKNAITPIMDDNSIVSARFDAEGKDILALKSDGTLLLFDGLTGMKKTERTLPLVFPEDGKGGPSFTASRKYVYVTNPERGETLMLTRQGLADYDTFTMPGKPGKITLVGADLDENSDHQ